MNEEIRKLARSGFGFNSIVLHELGYKLEDQADLTHEQKVFLIESYKFYQEKMKESGDGKKSPRNNMEEVRRKVKENGRGSNHNN